MRGEAGQQDVMFSYVKLERRVPADHPLRAMRTMADLALRELDGHFAVSSARRCTQSAAYAKVDSCGVSPRGDVSPNMRNYASRKQRET